MWPYTDEENTNISLTKKAFHKIKLHEAIKKGYTAYKQEKFTMLAICVVPSMMLALFYLTLTLFVR